MCMCINDHITPPSDHIFLSILLSLYRLWYDEDTSKSDNYGISVSDKRTLRGASPMKNDNLNITFSIGKYMITILKFTYECQTWNTPSHSHSSNSYELHYIPQGK